MGISIRQAFVKLHLSILLAGFTGILGKLITMNEGLLVWYRMLFTALIMGVILQTSNNLKRIPGRELLKIAGVGLLLALHWVFFFGSIKVSNVSIGVVCFSLTGFFTAILEPIMNQRRISVRELLFSLIAVVGILFIFQFDMRYRLGIGLGVMSALLAALFTITNKKVGAAYSPSTLLFYEMIGGLLCLTCLMPFYLHYFPVESVLPNVSDLIYLLLFALFCTVFLYLLQIEVLQRISAFTVNLSYNLEPVYSIILAMLLLGEANELHVSFYLGLTMIALSVLFQFLFQKKAGV